MDLADFLLARIAEDEERLVHEFDCDRFHLYGYGARQGDCDCDATARLLAECDAKLRIVKWAKDWPLRPSRPSDEDAILRLLALPYADHPDFDEAWRV